MIFLLQALASGAVTLIEEGNKKSKENKKKQADKEKDREREKKERRKEQVGIRFDSSLEMVQSINRRLQPWKRKRR